MNTQIINEMAELAEVAATIDAAGMKIISIRASRHDCAGIHVENDAGCFFFHPIKHDFERGGDYDSHTVVIGSVHVFWLTAKAQVAA